MNIHWRRIAITLGFVGGIATLAPACVVRGSGAVRVKPAAVVVDVEPPPPRRVTVRARAGYVWIEGHHAYRNGRWVWVDGRWERERAGSRYVQPHWERRGNRWHFVQGHWVRGNTTVVRDHRTSRPAPQPRQPDRVVRDRRDPQPDQGRVRDHRTPRDDGRVQDHRTPRAPANSQYPTDAPPAPRVERKAARAGYVWIPGHWEWKAGKWDWQNGHWERARTGQTWVPGRWERRGNHYQWVPGRWQ